MAEQIECVGGPKDGMFLPMKADWVDPSIPLPVKLTIGVAAVTLAAAVAANIFA